VFEEVVMTTKARVPVTAFAATVCCGILMLALLMSTAEACDCGAPWGDVNADGAINPVDVLLMVNRVYKGIDGLVQPPDCPFLAGDADCDGAHTPVDVISYVNFAYKGVNQFCSNPCPGGRFVGRSECGGYEPQARILGVPDTLDCLQWQYDGQSLLQLRHVNAGFNCCPELAFDIQVEDNTITIEEIEILGGCHCLCLFDLDFEISNLPPGIYTFRVTEPYAQPDDEPLTFMVDFVSSPSGMHCVPRDHYPWGQQ
jgi:hypothetical protein